MPTEILMPALSPTMEEGTLAKWLVKEGDEVKSGDIIAEIETDKATMEFEAVDEGKIGKILVDEGSAGVKVNTPIAVLLEEGESADDIGEISSPGPEAPEQDAPEKRAPAEAPKEVEGQARTAKAPSAAPSDKGDRIFASPLARRIAAEKGIELSAISGSGPRGRIVKSDVENAKPGTAPARTEPAKPAAAAPAEAPKGASADAVARIYADRETEEVTLDGMRRTIAQRLGEAKQTIPHFYLRRSAKLDELMKLRATLNKQLEGRGVKLSVNDFVIKASALALQQVPDANAVWAGDRIIKLKPSDVAVAVAVEGGLFTPVLKDAEAKTLSKLSTEMKDLAGRAKNRKLAPHEYLGGSFAVSNLGMFGIENFDAVINPPHGAILAVGAGIKTPVVENDEIVIRNVMSMTLSVDHRVIDGALGAQLLNAIVDHLENPMGMLA
ncbi:MAG: pyruvate dehydrogenase complex dihydrolipoamide acetyltransferase [Paracoccus sp. (in: a-proteobacteria)]|uniref:pyruvate dehydrogenase complex dihydrolipoamide acetyltransferase n=1 Tax=unclassified Paracoccus (in: a-proteobacteria) TaxID=2688777 RepID=UPI000C4BA0F4|nr:MULTISPECIES: pyruvate dehydrogenase complex dihydrolipoamide acetyltransferase [unclassified Paracoccus (in: a-proteobacteria)]MBA49491.1 pyruvate dehydrogenase complex dihydrolipoamide acetyltransferase [Paracoccus sp. (in: a-proteobacteria)]|tara:strand:+ start:988 stop:2307 length:1320 start_codon:yes stop_codon:yes gene_type:complete